MGVRSPARSAVDDPDRRGVRRALEQAVQRAGAGDGLSDTVAVQLHMVCDGITIPLLPGLR
jgi:hypothetical protein